MLVSASSAKLYWRMADEYGIARAELLRDAGLDPDQLSDPNALVPQSASYALLRALARHSDDPALGLRLAHAFELRAMGFWGYALLSSLTLRQRIQLHLRYHKLHYPEGQLSFHVIDERALVEFTLAGAPPDLLPILLDFSLAVTCIQFAKQAGTERADVALALNVPEQPHHQGLRALITGPIEFNAPCVRVSFAERDLDRRLPGDVHLLELAKTQLELQLARVSALWRRDLIAEVRERVRARLASDASLESIASDLRLSARSLRRHLNAAGASFHALLEEARRTQAMRALIETNHAIERVAQDLGYRDPANFRRAFRRWTGAAPGAFRAARRGGASS
jgi:AraC-like DNA-binding protein